LTSLPGFTQSGIKPTACLSANPESCENPGVITDIKGKGSLSPQKPGLKIEKGMIRNRHWMLAYLTCQLILLAGGKVRAQNPKEPSYPINLPTALQLAEARPIDIAVAQQRIQFAAAQLQQADALWLPTVYLGGDYFRHDGQVQAVDGPVFTNSKSSLMVGAGPSMVFALSDALFAPLAQRQVRRAQEAALQTARNDTMLAVAEAYFNIQQARGELIGAEDARLKAEDLVKRTAKLAEGLVAEVDVVRARTELARRRQAVHTARERWQIASAELNRVLRLNPSTLVEPLEPPQLQIPLIPPEISVDELIRFALSNRPELASQQAFVQATLEQLKQERIRPLVPSVLLRGASTPVTGTLAGGYFGGGSNGFLGNFGAREDVDLQVLWELKNLGFGNHALIKQRRADNQIATLELFRIEDRIAKEVVEAQAQAKSAALRVTEATAGLKDAQSSFKMNLEGMEHTKKAGNLLLLVIRPQEVVAAVQALNQAYSDFFGAVADFNRAQFRLYRALGNSAMPALDPARQMPQGHPLCHIAGSLAIRTPPAPAPLPARPVVLLTPMATRP
jgi:outer membrane protein TolC